jgi:phosphoglycerate dehydrogenase-like enzyme
LGKWWQEPRLSKRCGRGDVIDESSLVVALDRGYISAAILDVFEREPLPKESPGIEQNVPD